MLYVVKKEKSVSFRLPSPIKQNSLYTFPLFWYTIYMKCKYIPSYGSIQKAGEFYAKQC